MGSSVSQKPPPASKRSAERRTRGRSCVSTLMPPQTSSAPRATAPACAARGTDIGRSMRQAPALGSRPSTEQRYSCSLKPPQTSSWPPKFAATQADRPFSIEGRSSHSPSCRLIRRTVCPLLGASKPPHRCRKSPTIAAPGLMSARGKCSESRMDAQTPRSTSKLTDRVPVPPNTCSLPSTGASTANARVVIMACGSTSHRPATGSKRSMELRGSLSSPTPPQA
mmetsp:Transcript_108167/g.305821  ORF Transcript_108167/g.305821 Transcript_108167/m.305821 type:complete len:224 (-) Transcript_108167:199-870(-)